MKWVRQVFNLPHRAPASAHPQRSESPLQASALRPVTDRNCVAVRPNAFFPTLIGKLRSQNFSFHLAVQPSFSRFYSTDKPECLTALKPA
jgi:hypothetical protein